MSSGVRRRIDILFQRLLLGERRVVGDHPSIEEFRYALSRASLLLRSESEATEAQRFEYRLRLALHLVPRDALTYVASNPRPRFRLIQKHLEECFFPSTTNTESSDTEELARDLAQLLSAWEEGREGLSAFTSRVLKEQGGRCASCRLVFGGASTCLSLRDPFKPYFGSPTELMTPELDHVEAISALGTNQTDNMQVLCRFCNSGKWDGMRIDSRDEFKFAGLTIGETDTFYRARLFYSVCARDESSCSKCESSDTELTMRRVRKNGCLARSNLVTMCTSCAGWDAPDLD